jgi:hypothetical protein
MLGVSAAAQGEPEFLTPAAGDTLAAGVRHEVRWQPPSREREADIEMELLLSIDGGLTFPIRITSELPAGTTSFRWRIPAVPTASARLALRTGEEGRPETERIAFLSGPFRIVAPGTSPADLRRGPAEWWTEQALLEIGAEGRLGDSLKNPPERLHHSESDADLDETPSGFEPLPERRETETPTSAAAVALSVADIRALHRSAPLPLRE